MFVIRDGKKIAKRDQQTKTWISLEPGWQVFDADGGEAIEIVYRGTRVQ
jgi:hypothetical protein